MIPKLLARFKQDELDRVMTEFSRSGFYDWPVRIDGDFVEAAQLEHDFNSGPPDSLRRFTHKT